MLQIRRVTSIPAVMSVQSRAPAAAAAMPWYLAGGAVASTIVNAHQAKNAASYSASLLDLGPAGNNLTEHTNAPGWSASYGWRAVAANQQALMMPGTINTSSFSWYLRVANISSSQNFEAAFGAYSGYYNTQVMIIPNAYEIWSAQYVIFSGYQDVPPYPTAVFCLTSSAAYVDGVYKSATAGDGRPIANSFGLFAFNKYKFPGVPDEVKQFVSGDLIATARYNVQHDATTVMAITAAMAAL